MSNSEPIDFGSDLLSPLETNTQTLQTGLAEGTYIDVTPYFLERSKNYQNLYDPRSGYMRPRDRRGKWKGNFDPFEYKNAHPAIHTYIHQRRHTCIYTQPSHHRITRHRLTCKHTHVPHDATHRQIGPVSISFDRQGRNRNLPNGNVVHFDVAYCKSLVIFELQVSSD